MAIAKCRLDMWNPTLGGNATNKWITAQTPENRNAVISVYIFDKLANPRTAEVIISNRAKNFAAPAPSNDPTNDDPPSIFSYTYKDSDGVNSTTVTDQSLRTGVLTDLFADFQFIRLVDEATHQVLFVGRVLSITESYDAGKGITLKLKAVDALYELAKITLRGLSESIEFTQTTHSVTDIVKALISLLYKKEKLGVGGTKHINANSGSSTTANVADCIADTIYYPTATVNQYRTNIVTDDTGSELRNRFVTELVKLPKDRKIDLTKIKKEGFLGVILEILQANPQDAQTNSEKFGWDYFVDPNISYGKHADFRGKNLDASTKPPPMMFNAFERGNRIYNIEPATYGLAVKFPAASNVVTQGHKIVAGENIQFATKPMSVGFEFTRPKDDLYSSVLLKYNDGTEGKDSDRKEAGQGQEKEIIMEIIYVTLISGTFKYQIISGSGNTRTYSQSDYDDDEAWVGANEEPASRPGVRSSEWLSLYTVASGGTGTPIRGKAARIQYQSDATLSGSDVGYIIVSGVSSELLNVASGTYILKGMGDGTGTNGSGATCRVNLGTSIANQGYPRRVWGLDKQKVVSKGVINDLGALRQEAASTLSRSSVDIIDGVFTISGAPVYYWDGEIKTISSVTGGQRVTFQNVGLTTDVELWRYGFRAGMLMARMNDSYTAIDQEAGKDVYGYCFNVESDTQYDVNLTEAESFAADEKVRCFIPLRAGDTIRVENVITNVAGNHLIKEITYTEEPNQMTRLKTTGVNEGFGLGATGFQASLAGMREESDIRMNLPKGHQVATWTGLFSAVDNNTVQWQTVGGKAEVILAGGSVYNVDCATTNNNNTTHASGTDNDSDRFGIANALHPVAGDDTVYYIYLDPNKENVEKGIGKSHFYTRPSSSPDSGSDPVYDQDGDNIIIGWMKAGATTDDLAEFGVYRDSKPGEGKRNLPSISHPGSATSALLKKGAQTFTSDLQVQASLWADDLARREVKWHGGEATADTTNANIKLADGDDRTIAYGGDSGDTGGGSYSYTTNGTSYSTLAAFVDNTTYYGFIDFKEDATGNMILRWTNSHTVPYGDNRILLVMIVIPPDATKGRSPIIIPFGTKSLSINAVAIAANSITADHVAAGTISAAHIVAAGLPGSTLNIDSSTTFSSGFDPRDYSKTITTAGTSYPSSPNNGDLFVKTNDSDKLYRWNGSAWVHWDLGLSRDRADDAFDDAADAQDTADDAAAAATLANSALDDIADDSKVTPDEKNVAKRLYTDITSEYAGVLAEGTEYAVSTSNYTTYYNALVTYITTVHTGSTNIFSTTNMELTTPINRTTWDARWSNYYTHRQVLLNAIARKAKEDGIDVAATKRTTFTQTGIPGQASAPSAIAAGDVWIHTGNPASDSRGQHIYTANAPGKNNWVLRDDAGAINNATTNISGGRILTQAIILKSGGAGNPNNTNSILSEAHDTNSVTGTRILLHNTGIFAYNGDTAQFYLQASDGKAYFGGGAAIADSDGMHILTSSNSGAGDSTSGYLQFHYGTSASNSMSNTFTTGLRALSATKIGWLFGNSGDHEMGMNTYRLTTVGAINGGDSSTSEYGFWRPPLLSSAASAGDVLKISSGAGTLASPYVTTFDAVSGGGSGEANEYSFKTISVSGQTNVVADADDDTLTLVASGNMVITTSGDTITFNASGAAANHNHSSTYSTFAFKQIDINNTSGSYSGGSWGTSGIAAASIDDILYLVEGSNITLESYSGGSGGSRPAIKISASGGGANVGSSTPSTQAHSDSAATGSSAEAARVDHKHAMPAAGGSGQNNEYSFKFINVSANGGSASGGTVTANTTTDILTFKAGTGITLLNDDTSNVASVTITASASGTVTSGDAGYVAYYPNAAATVDSRISGGIEFISGTNIKLHGHTNLMSYSLKFEETGSGTDTVSIQGPSYIGTSYTLTLPQDDGDPDQVLKTNGSGVLDWVANSAGDANTNSFKFIARSGNGSGSTITAQNDEDTITLIGGANITIVHGGTGANPTIEIAASGSTGVTSIGTTSPILGGTITSTGTITHSTASGHRHIPTGGSGSSGSRQVLTYNGVGGTATFQNASEHGSHSGGGLTYWDESGTSFAPKSSQTSGGYDIGTPSNGVNWLHFENAYGIKTNFGNSATIIWETHGHHEFKSDVHFYGNASIYGKQELASGSSGAGYMSTQFWQDTDTGYYRSGNDEITFKAGGQVALVLDETSNVAHVGIAGAYSSSYNLNVNGNTRKTQSGSTWDSYSDDRIKTDVASLSGGMATIAALNPVSYKHTDAWKEAVNSPQHYTQYGFLASEYKTVFPNYTTTGTDDLIKVAGKWHLTNIPDENEPKYTSLDRAVIEDRVEDIVTINEGAIVPYLVAAIKELEARISVLEGN